MFVGNNISLIYGSSTVCLLAGLMALMVGCGNQTMEIDQAQMQQYLHKGDSITTAAQTALLANVAKAIKEQGIAGAVDFCSEKAIPLTDSVAAAFTAPIQRLSDKNRNPNNGLKTVSDSLAWQQMKELVADTLHNNKHFVAANNKEIYYYKAITIGMPTCLSCHGDKQNTIEQTTLKTIQQKYPLDKATDYKLGDLRGMWKVKIK